MPVVFGDIVVGFFFESHTLVSLFIFSALLLQDGITLVNNLFILIQIHIGLKLCLFTTCENNFFFISILKKFSQRLILKKFEGINFSGN